MRPLVVGRTSPGGMERWDAALRVGRPVCFEGPLPDGWDPSEVWPLARASAGGATSPDCGGGSPATRDASLAVTVVIPSHRRIPWGIRALRQQDWDTRVLVVRNGAMPSVVPGAEVWSTHWTGHADTRRRALARVETPFVLMMSDDAIPLGRGFVGALMARMLADELDAVVARQIPWPTASMQTRRAIRAWTPPTGGWLPHADHVATLYRTERLRALAQLDVPIAEDLAWTRGCRVQVAPGAHVLHSHPRSVRSHFVRRRLEHRVRAELGAPLPIPGLRAGLRALGPAGMAAEGPKDLLHRLADVVGMALGAHEGREPR